MSKNDKYISVPLTISLLTEECTKDNLEIFISDYKEENIILKDSNYILYKKNGNKDYPKWLKDFQKKVLKEPNITDFYSKTISEGLTLIKDISYKGHNYIFAINFGQGRHNIVKGKINNTFGIFVAQKILLNKQARVKIAQSRSIEGDPVNKNRMFANEIDQEALFSLLDSDEVMRELNLLADKDSTDFSSVIGKYGPLNIKFKFKQDEIPCIKYLDRRIIELIELYNSITDAQVALLFKGLQPVKKSKSEELYSLLCEKLLDNNNKMYLFEPEMDYDFMRISGVKYKIDGNFDKDEQLYAKLDFNDYLNLKNNLSLDDLKNDQVILLDEDGNICKCWNIIEALYGEFKYEDGIYILSNEIWHKVEEDKYNRINKIIKDITNNNFVLKDDIKTNTVKKIINYTKTDKYKKSTDKKIPREGLFNIEFAKSNGYILLDKKLINIDGDQIEVCDSYNQDGNEFIHAKIGTSADKLTHLFAQGYASARAYKMDTKNYINKVKDAAGINIPDTPIGATINYLIINSKKVNELTFLSKMTLIEKIENLQAFGFNVKLTWINDINIYPKDIEVNENE